MSAFPESLQDDGMMIAVVRLSLHISWVSESITMSSQIIKGHKGTVMSDLCWHVFSARCTCNALVLSRKLESFLGRARLRV